MARPVVATSNAVQGIPDHAKSGVHVVDDLTAMADATAMLIRSDHSFAQGRAFVVEQFSWKRPMDTVRAMFDFPESLHGSYSPEAA